MYRPAVPAFLALLFLARSPAAPADQLGVKDLLSWLPPDTETVIGANGPFKLKDIDAAGKGSPVNTPSAADLKLEMQNLALGLLSAENGGLSAFLADAQVGLALEGSRRFRRPKDKGAMLYEGCAILVLDSASAIDPATFMHKAATSAKSTETVEGVNFAVFEEALDDGSMTTYVGFPRSSVVLVASSDTYMRALMARMHTAASPRALPDTLAEWKYVNTNAPAWAVRHYVHNDSADDPTSPFHGKDAANVPDKQATGVAFSFDADGGAAALTYLSANTGSRKMTEEFLGFTGPASTSFPTSRVQFRQAAPGVLECNFPLSIPKALANVPLLGLMAMLGHATYM